MQTVDAVGEAARVSDPDGDLASLPFGQAALVEHLSALDRGDDARGLMLERAEDKDRLSSMAIDDRLERGDLS